MGTDDHSSLVSEIAALTDAINRAAAATDVMLAGHPPRTPVDDPRSRLADYSELCRQLAALRGRVTTAEYGSEDPRALRAELATLLFFARTLQADADCWRSAVNDEIEARTTENRGTPGAGNVGCGAREACPTSRHTAADDSSNGGTNGAATSGRVPQNGTRVYARRRPHRLFSFGVLSQERVSIREAMARDAQPRSRSTGQTRVV